MGQGPTTEVTHLRLNQSPIYSCVFSENIAEWIPGFSSTKASIVLHASAS